MINSTIDAKAIDKLARLLREVKNVVLTCHLSPDGDAMGSSMGLCHLLRNMGKNAIVITPDQFPLSLKFMSGTRDVVVYTCSPAAARLHLSRAELVMCMDFNVLQRIDKLGAEFERLRVPRVLIDHHLNPAPGFDVAISMPQASSTCELVYRTVMQLGLLRYLDRTVAENLFVGLMTDTGNFSYSCDDPEVWEIASELLRKGIDRDELYKKAMNTFSESSLRLQGYAVAQKMQINPERGVALISLSQQELKQFNYRKGDTEGLVNKPLAIPGVRRSIFLREDADKVKVSMRSVGDFAVDGLCHDYFGGGGHKNAAGGEMKAPLQQVEEKVEEIIASLPTLV